METENQALILSNVEIAKDVWKIDLKTPQADGVKPGQFVMVELPGLFLRRPATSEEKLIEVSLATWCDSISVEFAADSIVTPKGLVIHRPIVKSKKANPGAIAKANSRILTSDSVSSTASVRHDRNFGQSVKTEEQSEPPEPFSIIGLLVIIVVIAISGIITISFISRKRRP